MVSFAQKTSTPDGCYCALGEAVNGPGGYFGSNLDALADCLSKSHADGRIIRIEWSHFAESATSLGDGFTRRVLSVFDEFGLEVLCT
ncbi:barstar family protein [Streptomyces violascens]|uniref:barstar family protein n=1 Tax=Streptomyces violascens TaxID=67381 RepID=UPI00368658AA